MESSSPPAPCTQPCARKRARSSASDSGVVDDSVVRRPCLTRESGQGCDGDAASKPRARRSRSERRSSARSTGSTCSPCGTASAARSAPRATLGDRATSLRSDDTALISITNSTSMRCASSYKTAVRFAPVQRCAPAVAAAGAGQGPAQARPHRNVRKYVVVAHTGLRTRPPSAAQRERDARLLDHACSLAAFVLENNDADGHRAVTAAADAMAALEEAPWTNAGTGSLLNEDGAVECDASMVQAAVPHRGGTPKRHTAAVAALSTAASPTRVVESLLLRRLHLIEPSVSAGPLSVPCCIAGKGADNLVTTPVPPAELVTVRSRRLFEKYRDAISRPNSVNVSSTPSDTVGVIVWSDQGEFVAACSSGGPILKPPGRVGPAALVGAGCWSNVERNGDGAAVVTTGHGESIVDALFAKVAVDERQCLSRTVASAAESAQMGAIKCSRIGEELRVEVCHTGAPGSIVVRGLCAARGAAQGWERHRLLREAA